jgi:DNA adenine methylase
LKPIIKWPGGKERELPVIMGNAPSQFENFYDPFVGGGSAFTAFDAKRFFINDKSAELVNLYRFIASRNAGFYGWLDAVVAAWGKVLAFADGNRSLCDLYARFRDGDIGEDDVTKQLQAFACLHAGEIDGILPACLEWRREFFSSELANGLPHKFRRMAKIERERKTMPDDDIFDNIETAFAGALYTYLRELYNNRRLKAKTDLSTALFVFLRNYAYSGMFRYNGAGDFNVPYGGITYNHKSLSAKIAYYRSPELLRRFSKTTVENLDFEDFFKLHEPTERDFVFLDPPYDTEFSTYAQNEFTRDDQVRLADYLCNHCRAKWMLVIKYTPFIHSLYDREGITIRKFDKKYSVSFMNRNDRDVEHLLIMNYAGD